MVDTHKVENRKPTNLLLKSYSFISTGLGNQHLVLSPPCEEKGASGLALREVEEVGRLRGRSAAQSGAATKAGGNSLQSIVAGGVTEKGKGRQKLDQRHSTGIGLSSTGEKGSSSSYTSELVFEGATGKVR